MSEELGFLAQVVKGLPHGTVSDCSYYRDNLNSLIAVALAQPYLWTSIRPTP